MIDDPHTTMIILHMPIVQKAGHLRGYPKPIVDIACPTRLGQSTLVDETVRQLPLYSNVQLLSQGIPRSFP